MEYKAYLWHLDSEEICIGGLKIKGISGNLEITSDKMETVGKFYRQIHLLQTGLILYGYQHQWPELIEISACPTAKTAGGEEKAIRVPLSIWKEIEWIFTDECHLTAYWCAAAIAAKDMAKKYLALYYGFSQLKRTDQLEEKDQLIWAQLKQTADQIRCDEEEMEEKGLEIPDVIYDPDFAEQISKQLFDKVNGRRADNQN